MRRNSIFHITSIGKPIAAVVGMILVEEQRIELDDPIDPVLPEPAGRKFLSYLES